MYDKAKVETFSEYLKHLRVSRNMSQKALALAAQMDQSYLAGLESGRRPPPRDKQLLRLANALRANEAEISELVKARAVLNFNKLGIQIDSSKKTALAHLIGIATGMTVKELGTLNQIAQSLYSMRYPEQRKETSMTP